MSSKPENKTPRKATASRANRKLKGAAPPRKRGGNAPRASAPKRPTLSGPRRFPQRVGASSSAVPNTEPGFRMVKTDRGVRARMSGSEFISPVVIGADNNIANGILIQRPNTPLIPTTRLTQIAEIYSRWEPIKWKYRFIPSLPSASSGTLVYAHDPDPSAVWANGSSNNTSRAFTLNGRAFKQVWEGANSHLPPMADYTDLWTSPVTPTVGDVDDRLCSAGQFVLIVAATIGGYDTTPYPAGTVVGMLELDYEIDFYLPRLQGADSGDAIRGKLDPATVFTESKAGVRPSVIHRVLDHVQPILQARTKDFLGASKVSEVLRVYTALTGGLARKRLPNAFELPAGHLPRGDYYMQINLYYDTLPSGALVGVLGLPTNASAFTAGVSAYGGTFHDEVNVTCSVLGTTGTNTFRDIAGVSHPYMFTAGLEFSVEGQSGYATFGLQTVALPDAADFAFSLNAPSLYTDFRSGTPSLKPRPKRSSDDVTDLEAVALIKRIKVGETKCPPGGVVDPTAPDDDGEDGVPIVAPPRYVPAPSVSPGSPAYVAPAVKIPSKK
jgi:hypothetical protein